MFTLSPGLPHKLPERAIAADQQPWWPAV